MVCLSTINHSARNKVLFSQHNEFMVENNIIFHSMNEECLNLRMYLYLNPIKVLRDCHVQSIPRLQRKITAIINWFMAISCT